MRESGYDPTERLERLDRLERGPSLSDTIELAVRRVATAIVIAGGLVAVGIYAGGGDDEAPRYQMSAADGRIFRVNTESGTVIACEGERCAIILQRGQDLEERLEPREIPKAETPALQPPGAAALPAPAPNATPGAAPAPAAPNAAPAPTTIPVAPQEPAD